MHPILFRRVNLIIYLMVAAIAATIPATSLVVSTDLSFLRALIASLPPTIAYAFLGLTAWFPCRALPIGRSSPARILAVHLLGASIASGMWLVLWRSWLDKISGTWIGTTEEPSLQMLFLIGVLLYLFTVAVHYLIMAIQASRDAEQETLRFQVLAREAELKAFKAQIDPHFLFNSLNSISSLTSSKPTDARRMTQQLADFFRRSLRVGGRPRITLGEELDLASLYLSIEEVRFGDRLKWEIEVEQEVREISIPPLLLQPLVENAVRHGIAGVVEGGTVRITANRDGEHAVIAVENDRDPDHRASAGEGIGIDNVKGRVQMTWHGNAKMTVKREDTRFRVEIRIPSTPEGEQSSQ